MNIINIIGGFLHQHFEDFTKLIVVILAFFGILFAVVGHYLQMGFNWKWFLFFEFPLYLFCGWALYAAYKLYKRATDIRKYNKEKGYEQEDY